jgi:peptide deformylase
MQLPLRYYGDPILRQKAQNIERITPEIIQLAQDMIETMIAHNGVGLAGPQVGQLLRIYVCRDEKKNFEGEYELGEPKVMINPILTNPSLETAAQLEGCLSIPGLHVNVERPQKIRIRYQTLEGTFAEEELSDFFARVNMHENDHLNGVLHFDRASPQDRKKAEPILRQIKKKYFRSV